MRLRDANPHHKTATSSWRTSAVEDSVYLPLFRYRPLSELALEDGKVREAVKFTERLTGRKLSGKTMVVIASKPAVKFNPLLLYMQFGFCSASGKYANIGCVKVGRVHELVHLNDIEMENEAKKKIIPSEDSAMHAFSLAGEICSEGRAVFAETLVLLGKLWTPLTAKFLNFRFAMMAGGALMALAGTLLPREWDETVHKLVGLLPGIGIQSIKNWVQDLLNDPITRIGFGAGLALVGASYWVFHNSLCTLAKKVGDPVKAFRISGEKVPRTLKDILFPLRFYKEEIEKAQAEKSE